MPNHEITYTYKRIQMRQKAVEWERSKKKPTTNIIHIHNTIWNSQTRAYTSIEKKVDEPIEFLIEAYWAKVLTRK